MRLTSQQIRLKSPFNCNFPGSENRRHACIDKHHIQKQYANVRGLVAREPNGATVYHRGLLRSLKKPNPIISQHVLCVWLSVRYVVWYPTTWCNQRCEQCPDVASDVISLRSVRVCVCVYVQCAFEYAGIKKRKKEKQNRLCIYCHSRSI